MTTEAPFWVPSFQVPASGPDLQLVCRPGRKGRRTVAKHDDSPFQARILGNVNLLVVHRDVPIRVARSRMMPGLRRWERGDRRSRRGPLQMIVMVAFIGDVEGSAVGGMALRRKKGDWRVGSGLSGGQDHFLSVRYASLHRVEMLRVVGLGGLRPSVFTCRLGGRWSVVGRSLRFGGFVGCCTGTLASLEEGHRRGREPATGRSAVGCSIRGRI